MKSLGIPRLVWVVLVVAHVIALGWALRNDVWAFPDSDRYLQAADNLRLYGELYARPWPGHQPLGQAVQEFTIRPLGYPLVVCGLGGIKGKVGMLLVIQNLLSLLNLTVVLTWWARWARPRAKSWLLVMLGVLSFPAQVIYANAVMSEMLLQTVVVAVMIASLLFIQIQTKKYFLGIAGGLILALLLKPVFYPLAIVLAGIGTMLAWRRRQLPLALIGLGPAVVVGLYMGWNWERTGYFHFSSIAEINLLHYNAAGVVREVAGSIAEGKWVADVLQEANAQDNFPARQYVIQARASAVLWAHPVVYARQHVQGMVTMFLDPGRFDISQFLGLKTPAGGGFLAQIRAGGFLAALARLPVGLLSGLGIILLANVVRLVLAVRGFRQLQHHGPGFRCGRWVAAGLLVYVAVLTGPLGAARFLVPVWPLLLALGLAGLPPYKEEDATKTEGAAANA